MPRLRSLSRLTVWAFAGALLLKSAVPILASTAAALQGKAVAEICDVYGVDTVRVRAPAAVATVVPAGAHTHTHHHGDASGAAAAIPEHGTAHADGTHGHGHGDDAPQPAPVRGHGAKAGDHCVLSGMVAIVGGDVPAFARLASTGAAAQALASGAAPVFDAVARWATLLEHGPPALS